MYLLDMETEDGIATVIEVLRRHLLDQVEKYLTMEINRCSKMRMSALLAFKDALESNFDAQMETLE